ncbi:hypothetical protein C2E23DRAFT_724041, partial [Lenzites betulinus]
MTTQHHSQPYDRAHRSPTPTIGSDFSIATSYSVLDMPVEGSRRAPKQFRGEASDVEPFLRKYERLALSYHLSNQEKCETVTDYCGRVVRETIEGFPSYQQGNWTQLKEDIRVFWNADLESKRFRIKDLQRFVSESKQEPVKELRDWRQYLRNYVRIAGWLQGKQKISEADYAYYMWIGLPKPFRRQLEPRILLEDPAHDMSVPFSPQAMDRAAKSILSVDRFDMERLGSRRKYKDQSEERYLEDDDEDLRLQKRSSPRPRQWDEDDDEEDDDLSDEEDEQETRKKQIRKYAQDQQEKLRQEQHQTLAPSERKTEDKELDTLIEQLRSLQLDDPQYAVAYLKACRIDPTTQQCFCQPVLRPPPRFNQNVTQKLPPRMEQHQPSPATLPVPRPNCYGCGQSGHIMNSCPELQKYLSKGRVLRDYRGRITDKTGMVIRWHEGETVCQAIERILPEVNYIAYGRPTEASSEPKADIMIYPVDNTQRNASAYQKQTFDGVEVPTRKARQREPGILPMPVQRKASVEAQPIMTRMDIDVDMTERTRSTARISDVARTVDPARIAEKLLDLPITLPVREIAGSSREIASNLIDMLKLKKVDTVSTASLPPTSHLVTSHTGSLIRLQMECNLKPVTFIVDTGSQLNIISEKVCKNIVRRPINTGESITMNDANGGTGRLLGLVEDIPLKLGHVATPISAYVAESPPFDGLLGRPWQQAHKIGIEERDDGTYLTF